MEATGKKEMPARWGPARRTIASLLLAGFLAVVFLGPVTNPIATEELTVPLGRALAPVHQALFLGHGYRFFAPDPGPGHRVVVRRPGVDGDRMVFPDRQTIWPRLMYHRWFMLAETMWAEQSSLPGREDFDRMQQELRERAGQMALAGHHRIAASLRDLVERQGRSWTSSNRRRALLFDCVEREMRRRTGEPDVTLVLQERLIPLPADVLLGSRLSDARYLTEPFGATGSEVIDQ